MLPQQGAGASSHTVPADTCAVTVSTAAPAAGLSQHSPGWAGGSSSPKFSPAQSHASALSQPGENLAKTSSACATARANVLLGWDGRGTLREEHSISVSPSTFWSDSMVALRTSRVSRSPSTMAWHSRFSFSRKRENTKVTAQKPRLEQPHKQQRQHNRRCLQSQAARSWPFLQRAISLKAVCSGVCTEQLLLPVPAGFEIFFSKDNKFPLIAFQCQPC